jgi:hypothetical protein
MIGDLCDIVKNEGIIQDVIVSNVIVEETIQDIIVEPEEIIQDIIVEPEEIIQDIIVEPIQDIIVEPIQDIIVEEIIQDIIVEPIQDIIVEPEEIIQDIIVEEIIQDVIVEPEEIIQDINVEEIIQDVIVEENDTSNDMRAVQCDFVSNIIEEEEEEEGEDVDMKRDDKGDYVCDQCDYSTNRKGNMQKHFSSTKHKINSVVTEEDKNCKYQCKVCNKKYLSQPGLWAHKKKCKAPEPINPTVDEIVPEIDNLHAKIDNLERIMIEMAKNQQLVSNK